MTGGTGAGDPRYPGLWAPRVAVFCAASDSVPTYARELAAEVGTALGRRGWTLVYGGGRVGLMGEVGRAARAAGGHTVGVIPRFTVDVELADPDAELVVTETMRERQARMESLADAFLVLPGGLGTLAELLEVWTHASLGLHGKPIVVLDPDGHYLPLVRQTRIAVAGGFISQAASALVERRVHLAEAFEVLTRALDRRPLPSSVAPGESA
ncbi:MAG: TIGR00730 family Rossman fold protein [Phycicoccus sp.]